MPKKCTPLEKTSPCAWMGMYIAHLASAAYGLQPSDLRSAVRKEHYCFARYTAMLLCKQYTRYRMEDLARIFNREHSRICTVNEDTATLIQFDYKGFETKMNQVKEQLNEIIHQINK
jgi:chromosomal replication initiation ATPase DnaA